MDEETYMQQHEAIDELIFIIDKGVHKAFDSVMKSGAVDTENFDFKKQPTFYPKLILTLYMHMFDSFNPNTEQWKEEYENIKHFI